MHSKTTKLTVDRRNFFTAALGAGGLFFTERGLAIGEIWQAENLGSYNPASRALNGRREGNFQEADGQCVGRGRGARLAAEPNRQTAVPRPRSAHSKRGVR